MLEDGIQARSIHRAHLADEDWEDLAQLIYSIRKRGEWGIWGPRGFSLQGKHFEGSVCKCIKGSGDAWLQIQSCPLLTHPTACTTWSTWYVLRNPRELAFGVFFGWTLWFSCIFKWNQLPGSYLPAFSISCELTRVFPRIIHVNNFFPF
jgi:hypothetical protein